MPKLTVVIGSNGAGKSTWCKKHRETLPEHFYNPDSIAEGIGDWNKRSKQREAGEFVSRRTKEHLEKKESFGLETTYAGRSRPQMVKRAKMLGYQVHAIFIGTRNPEINVRRVAARVRNQTGHNVNRDEIRRRWSTTQENLVATKKSIDKIDLLDNSAKDTRTVGCIHQGDRARLTTPTPRWAKRLASRIEEVTRTTLQVEARANDSTSRQVETARGSPDWQEPRRKPKMTLGGGPNLRMPISGPNPARGSAKALAEKGPKKGEQQKR